MKVLLINPPNTDQTGFNSPQPGLLYLAGMLLRHDIDVRFVDGCLDGMQAVRKAVEEYVPDMVGIPCLTLYRKRSIEVADLVKSILPGVTIVFGGAHASIMYEQLLTHYPAIDCIVIGEGEETFLELAQGRDWPTIDGLAYRSDGTVMRNKPRKYVENLDDLPFPAWHLVDLSRYPALGRGVKNGINLGKTPRIPVVFSRGCKGHCDYCSSWWIWRGWRHRSPGNMADELELLYRDFGIRHFCFVDDAMTLDRPATLELCKEIVARELKIAFHITTRTDCVDEELLALLKAAGCYQIAFGVESGSPSMLAKIFKENSVEASEKAIRLTKAAGIFVTALIMVGNIGETAESIRETHEFLKRTQPDEIASAVGLYMMPGTKIFRECKKKGVIDDDFWLGDEPYRIYTEEYSLEELGRMYRIVADYLPLSKRVTGRLTRWYERYVLRSEAPSRK